MTTKEKLDLLDKHGFIYWPSRPKIGEKGRPQFKKYLGTGVAIQDIIADIPPVNSQSQERVDYPTQKPEALLKRIIEASSKDDALVLNSICGSGTTAVSAEQLQRRRLPCPL